MRIRRSRDSIILEILGVCREAENVTSIVYQANTNFTTIRSYLDMLVKNGLIEIMQDSPKLYKTTPKGIDTMDRLKALQKDMEELKL